MTSQGTDSELYKEIRFLLDELVDGYADHDYESYYPSIDSEYMPKIMELIATERSKAAIEAHKEYVLLAELSGNPSDTIKLETMHKVASKRMEDLGHIWGVGAALSQEYNGQQTQETL